MAYITQPIIWPRKNLIGKYIIHLRKEYRNLDIFDQVRKHQHYKEYCAQQDIDMFLLTCTDEHFQDLLDEQRDRETCGAV